VTLGTNNIEFLLPSEVDMGKIQVSAKLTLFLAMELEDQK